MECPERLEEDVLGGTWLAYSDAYRSLSGPASISRTGASPYLAISLSSWYRNGTTSLEGIGVRGRDEEGEASRVSLVMSVAFEWFLSRRGLLKE